MKNKRVDIFCHVRLVVFIVAGVLSIPQAFANSVITIESGACAACPNQNQQIGWRFDVLEPIVVTGLGWYSSNGIHWDHQLWLYDPNGVLLASTTILNWGSPDSYLDGQFTTRSVGPIELSAGSGYFIEGQNNASSIEILAYNALFSWIDPRIKYSGTVSNSSAIGPSFSVAPVPIPAAFWLFGSGLIGLFGFTRKRNSFHK